MLSIVPVPKQIIISDGIYCLPEKVSVLFSKIASTQRLKKALEEILDTFLICDSTTNSGDIVIERKELSPESYQLDITPNKIIIKASDETGVYYAIKTLKQIINTTSKKNIPVLSIFDEPDLKVRGVMQDVSRGKVPTLESLKKEIDLLSDLKYNHFEVYIEGTSFEYKKYSEYQKHGNYLTQEEYKELEKYANEHFIDLVPNMNGFGHMGEWLTIPQFEHLRETDGLFYIWGSYRKSATLDASNAESAEFVKTLYSELLDILSHYYRVKADFKNCTDFYPSSDVVEKEDGLKVKVSAKRFQVTAVNAFGKALPNNIQNDETTLENGFYYFSVPIDGRECKLEITNVKYSEDKSKITVTYTFNSGTTGEEDSTNEAVFVRNGDNSDFPLKFVSKN